MKLIPVVDLMQGQVVHARLGERQDYQPIQSPLCDSSEPISIIQALAALYRFDTLYIADLDAIQGNSGQIALLKLIQQNFPKIEILLDAGFN
ncbi:MAG: nickel transporter, partial [Candidatus Methylopumilus sp.]|nr:nickel transporter [Candidatus Methylopumilus sp.]